MTSKDSDRLKTSKARSVSALIRISRGWRGIGITFALLIGIWIVFAKQVVPSLIESAYYEDGLPLLNGLMAGRHVHTLEHYLKAWDAIIPESTLVLVGCALLTAMVFAMFRKPTFFRRFVGEATPGSIGAIRMLTCTILLISTIWEDLPSTALLPMETRQPMGMVQALYTLPLFEWFAGNETALLSFKWLTAVILFLGAIGWKTRFMIPAGALCYFVLGGLLRQYSHFFHTGMVPLYLMIILSWLPCGDGWSVDRLVKVYRGSSVSSRDHTAPIYGWSRYVCWLTIALAYVMSGLCKLTYGGIYWPEAINMRTIFYQDSLQPTEFDWQVALYLTTAPDWLFAFLGLTALLGELLYGLVLVSRVARLVFPSLILAMHVGILFMQNILFFDLMLLQLVFLDFRAIRKNIGQWLALKRGKVRILYDGLCPLCRRTMRLLTSVDLFNRLELIDFRPLNLPEYNRAHAVNLTLDELDREMYVFAGNRTYRGFYGYRVIACELPALWPIAPLLFLPGIAQLGVWVYSYIAKERLRLVRCDEECQTQVSLVTHDDGALSSLVERSLLRLPATVCGLFLLMGMCWLYRIEFYPFTAYPMYSYHKTSGTLTYYKVVVHYNSGNVAPGHRILQHAIGAMTDGRYLDQVVRCFSEADNARCKKFLIASGAAHNRRSTLKDIIEAFEIQKWKWDFLSVPGDSSHGTLLERVVVDIGHR